MEPVKIIPLSHQRMNLSASKRSKWFIVVPPSSKVEELLVPEYWRNHGEMLKPMDKIEAATEDGTWYAEFIVIGSDRLWAKVKQVLYVPLEEDMKDLPATDDQNHEVKWKGPLLKWAVVRNSDSTNLKTGFDTRLLGHQWLAGHLKSLG